MTAAAKDERCALKEGAALGRSCRSSAWGLARWRPKEIVAGGVQGSDEEIMAIARSIVRP